MDLPALGLGLGFSMNAFKEIEIFADFNLMRNRHFGYVLISLFDDESSHGEPRFSM